MPFSWIESINQSFLLLLLHQTLLSFGVENETKVYKPPQPDTSVAGLFLRHLF